MCKIVNFNFNNLEVRTAIKDKNILFCLVDVAKCLNISNPSNIIQRLDEAGLYLVEVSYDSGTKKLNFINEPNLYRVIFRSDKPEAKQFQNWVFEEVLPQLRKTGSYSLNNKDTYNYYTSDLISKDLTNLDIVRMDDSYNKERPCYWCPTVCTCGHCGIAKHLQVDQKNSLNLHCIFEKMIRSEIDKNYKQYDLLHKVIYDLVKTNRQIDWEVGFNWDFLERICDLAFIGYKAKYKYDTINNKPEEVKKRLCMA